MAGQENLAIEGVKRPLKRVTSRYYILRKLVKSTHVHPYGVHYAHKHNYVVDISHNALGQGHFACAS